MTERPPISFRYISLGAGVQSTAVLAMSVLGLKGCPKADAAIFADTQDEPDWVYRHLEVLERWAGDRGIQVYRCTNGKLSESVLDLAARKSFIAIPAYSVGDDGKATMLRRQCTREYKITPIERKVRELLGVKRIVSKSRRVAAMLGISMDEIVRVRDSRTPWCQNEYPLIDARMSRDDCLRLIEKVGLPRPRKSACVFCPFNSDAAWKDMKQNHPVEFERAVAFDEAVRDGSTKGEKHRPIYLHRSLRPLATVPFDAQGTLEGFGNECAGVCGV